MPIDDLDRCRAQGGGGGGRGPAVRFDVATAKELPGTGYDLVCLFDCLHDMGDPVGAARRIRPALALEGMLLLVEPLAVTVWRTA
jgi:hypothetical protein